jgi:hypothetical protein
MAIGIDVTVTIGNGNEYKSHFTDDRTDEFLDCDTVAACMFGHYVKEHTIHDLQNN